MNNSTTKTTETIYGIIVGKTNHYISVPDTENKCRIVLDDKYREYKKTFLSQVKIYKDRMINYPFILHVDVFYINDKFDLDNSVKTLCDLLQDCNAIINDKLCVEIHARKHIDKRNPRVEFWLQEIQPTFFW